MGNTFIAKLKLEKQYPQKTLRTPLIFISYIFVSPNPIFEKKVPQDYAVHAFFTRNLRRGLGLKVSYEMILLASVS